MYFIVYFDVVHLILLYIKFVKLNIVYIVFRMKLEMLVFSSRKKKYLSSRK